MNRSVSDLFTVYARASVEEVSFGALKPGSEKQKKAIAALMMDHPIPFGTDKRGDPIFIEYGHAMTRKWSWLKLLHKFGLAPKGSLQRLWPVTIFFEPETSFAGYCQVLASSEEEAVKLAMEEPEYLDAALQDMWDNLSQCSINQVEAQVIDDPEDPD